MKKTIMEFDTIEAFTSFIAEQTVKLMWGQAKRSPKTFAKIQASFLKHYINQMLKESFHPEADELNTKEENYEVVRASVGEAKYNIQQSVAEAFKQAFGEFTGKPVDYYVEIKPFPEPKKGSYSN